MESEVKLKTSPCAHPGGSLHCPTLILLPPPALSLSEGLSPALGGAGGNQPGLANSSRDRPIPAGTAPLASRAGDGRSRDGARCARQPDKVSTAGS